jgi:metal-dependent HD superfamily phosphatase/phosphodiesterase
VKKYEDIKGMKKKSDKESINSFSILNLSIHNINGNNPIKTKIPFESRSEIFNLENLLKTSP